MVGKDIKGLKFPIEFYREFEKWKVDFETGKPVSQEIGRLEVKGHIVRLNVDPSGELNIVIPEELLNKIHIVKQPELVYMGKPPTKVKKNFELEVWEYKE